MKIKNFYVFCISYTSTSLQTHKRLQHFEIFCFFFSFYKKRHRVLFFSEAFFWTISKNWLKTEMLPLRLCYLLGKKFVVDVVLYLQNSYDGKVGKASLICNCKTILRPSSFDNFSILIQNYPCLILHNILKILFPHKQILKLVRHIECSMSRIILLCLGCILETFKNAPRRIISVRFISRLSFLKTAESFLIFHCLFLFQFWRKT